jgi:hypothetical protein
MSHLPGGLEALASYWNRTSDLLITSETLYHLANEAMVTGELIAAYVGRARGLAGRESGSFRVGSIDKVTGTTKCRFPLRKLGCDSRCNWIIIQM